MAGEVDIERRHRHPASPDRPFIRLRIWVDLARAALEPVVRGASRVLALVKRFKPAGPALPRHPNATDPAKGAVGDIDVEDDARR